jgi:phytoene desaturase
MRSMTLAVDPAAPPRSAPTAARAVVVGSGFGGLAAAIRLAHRGYRVTVVERLDAAGGRAYVYRQDGFTFDAGPTIITAPFLLEELWAMAGRSFSEEVDLRLMDPFYRIRFDDGSTFDYSGDLERTKAEIAKFEPRDVEGYERYLVASEKIFRVGFEQLGDVPFDRLTDMLKIVPDMIRLGSHRSVYQLVARHIRNEKIRQVLSFHPLLVGGNPFDASSVYALISFLERKWGVHSAVGGTGAIVSGLVSVLEDLGGEIRYEAEVARSPMMATAPPA